MIYLQTIEALIWCEEKTIVNRPVLHFQFLWVINCSIAVHQEHRGGEIEDAGGEDEDLDRLVVRLTHRERRGGEIEAGAQEHDGGVQRYWGDQRGQDVEQGEAGREDGEVEVMVHLGEVALQCDENQHEWGLLSQRSGEHGLDLNCTNSSWKSRPEVIWSRVIIRMAILEWGGQVWWDD